MSTYNLSFVFTFYTNPYTHLSFLSLCNHLYIEAHEQMRGTLSIRSQEAPMHPVRKVQYCPSIYQMLMNSTLYLLQTLNYCHPRKTTCHE
jgi:hypothetical protein